MTKTQGNIITVCMVVLALIAVVRFGFEKPEPVDRAHESLQEHYKIMCEGLGQDCDKVED